MSRKRVRKVISYNHLKKAFLDEEAHCLILPRSASVKQGNEVEIIGDTAWVICKNGKVQILPTYEFPESLCIGSVKLPLVIKEITEPEEFAAYQELSEHHYRNQPIVGQSAVLVIRNFHPFYPPVIGYVQLGTSLFMNAPRNKILDAPFQDGEVNWEAWNKETRKRFIHTICRIARCFVYPEFRGLGLGKLLIRHATEFARHRWQVSSLKPCFLEISADMLKFIPFAEESGMAFIGYTSGNLNRISKDLCYLIKNFERIGNGLIFKTDAFSTVDQHVTRLKEAVTALEQQGWSVEEFIKALEQESSQVLLDNFRVFHHIVSLPKPTYLRGLTPKAESFLSARLEQINPTDGYLKPTIEIRPLEEPIRLENISWVYRSSVEHTERTYAICQAFGIAPDKINHSVIRNLTLTLSPGEVVLITGASGTGKTTLIQMFSEVLCGNKDLFYSFAGDIQVPQNYRPSCLGAIESNKPLIEALGDFSVQELLYLMGIVGLSDAFVYLKRFDELSNGQQYRARLAQLIAGGYNVWIADEFCSTLDVVTANIVSSRLQKLARRLKALLIVASSHPEMFVNSLLPDKVVRLNSSGGHQVMTGSEFSQSIT